MLNEIERKARDQIVHAILTWKTSAYIPMPSQWAEENRWLPAGTTEYPGKIDHSIAPHLVKIQDVFHPDSGIKQATIMKGTQALVTTAIENVIGHAIKYKLHNILYIISSLKMARVRSSAAIDVMIDNSGLADCVKPISQRMKRKIADSTFYKEFSGGRRLMMTSYNSIGDAKSINWDLIIMDEIDEAPYELKGQGDPESIFAGRGKTVRDLKIAKLGTPTNTNGRIYINFLNGDQQYYFCQCPLCGEHQVLELFGMGRQYGLTGRSEIIDKVEQIIPESVHYLCKHCKEKIYEYQKGFMLQNGIWRPTATPINKEYASFHISNLMSPVMFYSWRQVMQEFCETDWGGKITKFKNFVIDVLGWPWESRLDKKGWRELYANAEDYPIGEVPEGGLVVVGGCDVQKNRLELQVVAYGEDMEAWPIDYQYFYGETRTRNGPCWTALKNYVNTKKYKLKNISLPIVVCAIDTGYNPLKIEEQRNEEHLVYNFVAENSGKFIACRGNDKLKDMIIKEERVKRKSPLKTRYDVAVYELKNETFTKLELGPDAPGRIHFTRNMPQGEEYFKGFASTVYAETLPGKWEWKQTYERDEPLDTYLLTRAGAEYKNLPSWTADAWQMYRNAIFL